MKGVRHDEKTNFRYHRSFRREPEVHEQLKDFVQARVDEIVAALRESGEVEIIEAKELVL